MEFERKELQNIRERAIQEGNRDINQDWKRTFFDLASAADHLDAMIARCTIYMKEDETKSED